MPRKKDGMPYEVYPTPAKGRDGRNIVYVRPAGGFKVDMKQLDEFCSGDGYGLRSGELSLVFGVFMRAASELMAKGYRVETTLGSFAPKLALIREVTNPDEVRNSDVVLDGVEYKPGKRWNKEIGQWLHHGFRKEYTPDVLQLMADNAYLEGALKECLKEGYTTVKRFAEQAHLTRYSARKQLNAWTRGENPKLLKTRMGQQDIYTEL